MIFVRHFSAPVLLPRTTRVRSGSADTTSAATLFELRTARVELTLEHSAGKAIVTSAVVHTIYRAKRLDVVLNELAMVPLA